MSNEQNPYGNPADREPFGQNSPGPSSTQAFPAYPGAQQYRYGQPTADFPPSGQPPSGPYGSDPTPGRRRPGAGVLAAGALAFLLVGGAAGGAVGGYVASNYADTGTLQVAANGSVVRAQPAASAPDGTVQSVAAKVLPSVVDIEVATQGGGGEGSGVVLTSDGYILTNNHVATADGQGAVEMQVGFSDGSLAPATLVAADAASDIAVLKVEKTDLEPIDIGSSSNLEVGQDVVAVGSPLGLSGTVTSGIISSLNRPVSTTGNNSDQASVINAIQTDAAINPGNSGGALVNMNGELIGVNTAIATLGGNAQGDTTGSIGLGFAIPIDQAVRISDELKATGKATQAQIGISVPSRSNINGAEVMDVLAGGPAEQAGIKQGEVIVKVDDLKIDSGDALIAAVRSHTPGDKVQVTVVDDNGGNARNVDVTLAAAAN